MELPSQDGDIPIPINSSFGGGHGGHLIHEPQQHDPSSAIPSHNHHINLPHISSNGPPPPQPPPPPPPLEEPQPHHQHQHQQHVMPYKKVVVKYKECLKNHAASMGGTAMDGCGEFMPSGEEGTIEALTCSACNCHRNFHRKEVEGGGGDDHEPQWYNQTAPHNLMSKPGRKFIMGHQIHPKNVNVLGGHEPPLPPPPHHHHGLVYPTAAGTLISSRTPPPLHHQMIIPYSIGAHSHSGPSESDEHEDGGGGVAVIRAPHHQAVKKRFRTKFTQEQKEKMFNFAEKVGWKIQKQEESVVQQFCQEIGVKRRVLKVWMHNNKHNLAKKNPSNNNTPSSLN